jgi:hypothetical protein
MDHVVLAGLLTGGKQMGPDLAYPTLKGPQMAWMIASGELGLKLAEDGSTTAARVGLDKGADLLPLPQERVFAGVSPGQQRCAFRWVLLSTLGNSSLFPSSCFTWETLRRDAVEFKGDQSRSRGLVTGSRAAALTPKQGLLQAFHLMEEANGVECLGHSMQFLLPGGSENTGE